MKEETEENDDASLITTTYTNKNKMKIDEQQIDEQATPSFIHCCKRTLDNIEYERTPPPTTTTITY